MVHCVYQANPGLKLTSSCLSAVSLATSVSCANDFVHSLNIKSNKANYNH